MSRSAEWAARDEQMRQALVLPLVHLNGTSRESLLNGACAIGYALEQVLRALSEHNPNQRDYYPIPGRWEAAMAQHARRVSTITALWEELQAEAGAIADL